MNIISKVESIYSENRKKIIESSIDTIKWSLLVVLFFICYYNSTPKYEFKKDLRSNKVTGKIEVNIDGEWIDLLEDERNYLKEKKGG